MRKIFLLLFIGISLNVFAQKPCTPPVVNVTGTPWKCSGVRDTIHVSGPNGTTYLWNNGNTRTSYVTGPIEADSTFYVVATYGGCSDTTYFTVVLRVRPNISITPPVIMCAGSSVLLYANASGNGAFTYLWTPGGQTTDTITVRPNITTTYAVKISNGCISTKSTTVTPDNPAMTACCDKTILLGDDTILVASGNSIFRYQWFPSTELVCLNISCDSVIVTPTVTTTYTVVGTDTLGCQLERILTIAVEKRSNSPFLTTANPNPTFTTFTVSMQSNFNLLVRDEIGRVVISEQENAGTITFGKELSPGLYFMFIDGIFSGNLIKLKPEKP